MFLASACASTGGGGLPEEPVLKEYEPKRWVGTPKSGLRIIVQEDHTSPLVSIVTSVGVGATRDPKGVEGLAHFVEHLVFRSKPFGGDQQYWDLLKRTGGFFNASTSWDFTTYYTTAHKDQLELLMRLEAWRMLDTVGGVTEEVFTTEREVVRNELRQRWETTPGNRMFDLLFDSLYPDGHPLRRPVGGTHESLTASKLEHARAFVKEYYRPDNTTITIVGDVDTEEVKRLLGTWPAELLFGSEGPEGAAVEPRQRVGARSAPPVPAPVKTELVRYKGPIEIPALLMAWSLPPGLRGQDSLMRFAAGRLNLALGDLDFREEDDIMSAGAFALPLADSSVIVLQATLRPWADPEKARKRLLDVLVSAWTTDGQLTALLTESSRWSTATSLLRRASSPLGTAAEMSEYMCATGKHAYFQEQLEELADVKAGDVSDFAYKWLTRERAVAVYFEPESDKIPLALGGGGGGGGAGQSGGESASHDIGRGIAVNAGELTSDKLLAFMRPPGVSQVPRFTLGNGLEVFVIERPSALLAEIEIGLRGGDASVKPVGAASMADQLAQPKCMQYKGWAGLREVGGSGGGGVGLNTSTLGVAVLTGNLVNGLATLRDSVSCVEVSPEIFLHLPRLLGQQAKVFDRTKVYPDFLAQKWLGEQLYPDHPYGQVGFVSPDELKGLRLEDAQAFVSSLYRPDNGVAVIHGGVTVAEAKAAAEKYLGSWRGGAGGVGMAPPPAPPGPSERRIHLVNRDKATQAVVTIGCRLADADPAQLPAYDVLEGVAGESAWALREQWGATYGVHASVSTYMNKSARLVVGGAIENAQAAKSIVRLLRVIESIGTGSIAEPLFLTKRWDAGRQFMNSYATAGAMASAIMTARLSGWPLETFDEYPKNLAATTRESLKGILAPCVGKEAIAIVGDAAVLRPQLEAEGLKLAAE